MKTSYVLSDSKRKKKYIYRHTSIFGSRENGIKHGYKKQNKTKSKHERKNKFTTYNRKKKKEIVHTLMKANKAEYSKQNVCIEQKKSESEKRKHGRAQNGNDIRKSQVEKRK